MSSWIFSDDDQLEMSHFVNRDFDDFRRFLFSKKAPNSASDAELMTWQEILQ